MTCSLRRPPLPANDSSTENRRKRHKRVERANNRLARTFSSWARISSGPGAEGAGAKASDTATADCEVCFATVRLLNPAEKLPGICITVKTDLSRKRSVRRQET